MKGLGYLRDDPKSEDFLFKDLVDSNFFARQHAQSYSHRSFVEEVLDQGSLGSCVSNAGFGALRIKHKMQGVHRPKLGNRLHGYWGIRAYDSNTQLDSGGKIRNFFRFVNKVGFMPEEETEYGYDITKFRFGPTRREQMRMYDQRNRMDGKVSYYRISETGDERIQRIQEAIALGCPIVFGTSVAESFLNTRGSVFIERPAKFERIAGGHALLATGYTPRGVEFVNSWGRGWRDEGFAELSWDYMCWEDTHDLWAVAKAPYYAEGIAA
jgi:hypothetical protein